jgi:hypothetical protein
MGQVGKPFRAAATAAQAVSRVRGSTTAAATSSRLRPQRASRAFADAGRVASSREASSLATKHASPCGAVFSWALQIRSDGLMLRARERDRV